MFRVRRIAEGSFQLQRDPHAAIGTAFASCWCAIRIIAPTKSTRAAELAEIGIFFLKTPWKILNRASGISLTRQSGSRGLWR